MPVLFGPQGSSKTTAVEALLAPLKGLFSTVGFDILSDNSREYELSVMPVMFFDELAGLGKADVEKLKGMMTVEKRQMRQIFQRASTRTMMSTFIGCTNKDLSTLIRDETGNRRFLQIETPVLDRASFRRFDVTGIWRSVDEDAAEPPQYANEADRELIAEVQAGQRYKGPVQQWIEEAGLPEYAQRTTILYSDHFKPWAETHAAQKVRFIDLSEFRAELERLTKGECAHMIKRTIPGNVPHYRREGEPGEARRQFATLIELERTE